MDIAIQVTTVIAALLGIATVIVGTSSINNKFTVTLWLGYATAVVVLLGGCLYWQKQHWEAEAKAAAESAILQRPEVFIEEAKITPITVDRIPVVSLLLRNRGSRPARNVKIGPSKHSFKLKGFAGPLIYGPGESDTTEDLAAGAATVAAVETGLVITDERFEQLNSGDLLYFTYGKGTYEDDAGHTYGLKFCFMYSPMCPTILQVCPDRYWPESNHEN